MTATPDEVDAHLPGDEIVRDPDSVMDRAFTIPGTAEQAWPWIVQLGKERAGWYLPTAVERFVPPSRRAARAIDPRWQSLSVGEMIPDYGGPNETFEVAALSAPHFLIYKSKRRNMAVAWSIHLDDLSPTPLPTTRIHLRLRLGPIRHTWLVNTAGQLIDLLTIAGLAAGLSERMHDSTTETGDTPSGPTPC